MPRGIAADRDTAVRTVTPTRTASRQMNGFVEINTFIHLAPKQKSDQWMHLSPIYTRVHGEWLRYANSTSQFHWRFLLVRDDWGFQVNPLCRHDITRSDRQIGNWTNHSNWFANRFTGLIKPLNRIDSREWIIREWASLIAQRKVDGAFGINWSIFNLYCIKIK